MMRRLVTIVSAAALAAALAACGKEGELERPAPLWGAKAKAEYEAQQRAAAAAKAQPADNQPEPLPDEGPDAGSNAAGPPP